MGHTQIVTQTITTRHKDLEMMFFLCKNIVSFNKLLQVWYYELKA